MTKVALTTVGCRLNQYETERIAASLIDRGFEQVSYKEKADLYILNSCTVTQRADADCRKLVNRAHRLNEDAIIVITGCYVVSQPDQASQLPGVELLVDNDDKHRIVDILQSCFPHLFQDLYGKGETAHHLPLVNRDGASAPPNRAMVKVGDGCNQCCAYCIVPSVRGPLTSRPADDVLDEIRRLINDGYHEIVLTAVHIGKYKHDGLSLAGLVDRILSETDLSRLRLSSLEPNELDNRLIDYVANHPRVCRHLHLPLQSGSDRILKLMRRPYTRDDYLRLIERIKTTNADITLGCDLIVGFPGETNDDFNQSVGILDSGFNDYAHVFSYSDRPGTASYDMPDKIHSTVIKERNRIARKLGERNRLRQMESQIGKVLPVISEHVPHGDNGYHAVSDNYLKVRLPRKVGGDRRIVGVQPEIIIDGCLIGEVAPLPHHD
jgi:threonylcarbamoyladenosine tRNA methylthiotransferase MtaB